MPPTNDAGPDQSECALCVAQQLVAGYEKAVEKNVFGPIVSSARDRLNLLAPGAGDQFVDEARAQLNAAGLVDDGRADLVAALKTLLVDESIGDFVYTIRDRAAGDGFVGDSWHHPRVLAYSRAIEVLLAHYQEIR